MSSAGARCPSKRGRHVSGRRQRNWTVRNIAEEEPESERPPMQRTTSVSDRAGERPPMMALATPSLIAPQRSSARSDLTVAGASVYVTAVRE